MGWRENMGKGRGGEENRGAAGWVGEQKNGERGEG